MEIERRDIEGYEDYYQVSNTGLVRSLDRTITTKLGVRRIRGRLLSTGSDNKRGLVSLCIDANRHPITIAQLVFTTFIRKLNKKEVVSHKDGNCGNNNSDNLLAVDSHSQLTKNHNIINKTKVRRKIFQCNLSGEYIQTFESLREAAKSLGYKDINNISNALTGRTKSSYGYIRKYAE